jgi:two-component system sensor histidine kinase KdpD
MFSPSRILFPPRLKRSEAADHDRSAKLYSDSTIRDFRYKRYPAAIAMSAFCTLIDWPLRNHVGPTSILLVYLLGVFLIAKQFGRSPSILACLMSAMAFAYFFAPPIFSLAIADPENLASLAVMLLVALMTSGLMDSVRSQAAIATQRERRATALYELSRELALARQEEQIADIAVRHIQAAFGGSNLLLFSDAQGRLIPPSMDSPLKTFADMNWESLLRVFKQNAAFAGAEIFIACTGERAVLLPLLGAESAIGVIALLNPDPSRFSSPEQTGFLETVLNQIAQSLERVKLAEQARRSSVRVETEALRNSLLSAISHDLRTPLTTIVGASEALAEKGAFMTPEDRREFSLAIQEEAQRIFDLTNKILDMARLAAGELRLDREWSALEEIVGGALGRLEKSLENRPVNIQLPDAMPLIRVDAVLMQQVLINLLDNAVKYSPPTGAIDISANLTPDALHLFVADRGPGIPPGAADQVFEKFFRLHPETTPGGVGLGLAISRTIVEAHNGTLAVENRLGGGAIFSITLPLDEAPPLPAAEELTGQSP